MRSTSILVPLTILVIGGIWIATQSSEISKLEDETASLQLRLMLPSRTSPASSKPRQRKTALEDKVVDWVLVARELQSGHSQYGIYKSTLKLEEQLRRLSADELKSALNAIEQGDLDDKSLTHFTEYLLSLLIETDPAHIILHPSTHPVATFAWDRFQNSALGKWTKLAPNDATSWFDSQRPDTFPPERFQMLHHSLISSLAISDFPQAKERLASIPEQERFPFFRDFSSFGSFWTEQDFASQNITGRFAELTRLLPESQRDFISAPLTWLGDQDRPSGISSIQTSLNGWADQRHGSLSLQVLQDYLTKIEPTASELDLCIDNVISSKSLLLPDQTERDPQALRTWLQAEFKFTIRSK